MYKLTNEQIYKIIEHFLPYESEHFKYDEKGIYFYKEYFDLEDICDNEKYDKLIYNF